MNIDFLAATDIVVQHVMGYKYHPFRECFIWLLTIDWGRISSGYDKLMLGVSVYCLPRFSYLGLCYEFCIKIILYRVPTELEYQGSQGILWKNFQVWKNQGILFFQKYQGNIREFFSTHTENVLVLYYSQIIYQMNSCLNWTFHVLYIIICTSFCLWKVNNDLNKNKRNTLRLPRSVCSTK